MSKTTREEAIAFYLEMNADLEEDYGDMVEGRLFDMVAIEVVDQGVKGDYQEIVAIVEQCHRKIWNDIEDQAEQYSLKSSPYYLGEDRVQYRHFYR